LRTYLVERPSPSQLIQVLEAALVSEQNRVGDNDTRSIQAVLEELKKQPDTPMSIQYARNPPYWKWFTGELSLVVIAFSF
jgi:hypothetical protein